MANKGACTSRQARLTVPELAYAEIAARGAGMYRGQAREPAPAREMPVRRLTLAAEPNTHLENTT